MESLLVLLVLVSTMSSFVYGLKLICDKHDQLCKERDELWDRNGWHRPNMKK